MNVNELPDEMLCSIFDELDVYELKLASLVCRRWADLTFSDQRMDRVMLVIQNLNCAVYLNSNRKYRNIDLAVELGDDDPLESIVRLLHKIKPHIRMLDIESDVTSEQLGSILLEFPALQHLSLGSVYFDFPVSGPLFPVLPKLKSLHFAGLLTDRIGLRNDSCFLFFGHIANLQRLKMGCSTHLELEAWTYFSGQLKIVDVDVWDEDLLQPLLKLTFPLVEDFALDFAVATSTWYDTDRDMYSSLGHDFFRRHPSLRRISTCETFTPVEWVESICQHCPEITHLKLSIMVYPEEGLWESLVQLSKLKCLSLRGSEDIRLFRGAMKSLESVHLQTAPSLRVLGNLFDVGPQLSCLKICRTSYNEIQFICEKFACLRHLELYVDAEVSIVEVDSLRFDRLVHLQELNVSDNISIRSIHRNNVRCLTILGRSNSLDSRSGIMNSDLFWIPEKFPLLNRLILWDCSVSLAAVELLHHSVPSCRIDYDYKRFYPILDAPAR